jgi:hypothetical protein
VEVKMELPNRTNVKCCIWSSLESKLANGSDSHIRRPVSVSTTVSARNFAVLTTRAPAGYVFQVSFVSRVRLQCVDDERGFDRPSRVYAPICLAPLATASAACGRDRPRRRGE